MGGCCSCFAGASPARQLDSSLVASVPDAPLAAGREQTEAASRSLGACQGLTGFSCDESYRGSCVDPGQRRWDAHRETMREVVEMLQLAEWGEWAEPRRYPWFQDGDVKLFRNARRSPDDLMDGMPWAEAGAGDILGRFDVVSAKVTAKFGADWRPLEGAAPSWTVLHSAAVNLSGRPWEDFAERGGSGLNEALYLRAMHRLFCNILAAAAHEGVSKFLMFPFGMGAFLRHLDKKRGCDKYRIGSAASSALRRRVVEQFVKALEDTGFVAHVYLCIRIGDGADREAAGQEATENADAFLAALRAAPAKLRSRLTVVPDGDALQVAHDLAGTSPPGAVAMLNGAARGNLGNAWFNVGTVFSAIDENLHRRSPRMAAMSYLMNGYADQAHRRPRRTASLLADNVRAMGGEVVELPLLTS